MQRKHLWGVGEQVRKRLTVRCWKSHALMMLVATLGKIPLFLLCFFSFSGSSSSPVLGEATLLSRPSPVTWQSTGRDSGDQTHGLFTSCIRCAPAIKRNKCDFVGILEGFVCKGGGAPTGNNGERRMAGKKSTSQMHSFLIYL